MSMSLPASAAMVRASAYDDNAAVPSKRESATSALHCTKKKKAPIVMDRASIETKRLGGACSRFGGSSIGSRNSAVLYGKISQGLEQGESEYLLIEVRSRDHTLSRRSRSQSKAPAAKNTKASIAQTKWSTSNILGVFAADPAS